MAICITASAWLNTAPLVIVDDDLLDARVLVSQSVDFPLQHAVLLHPSASTMVHLKLRPLFASRYIHRHDLKDSQVLNVAQVGPAEI